MSIRIFPFKIAGIATSITWLTLFSIAVAEQTITLTLKTGTQVQCTSAILEGDQVILQVKYGHLTFDKSSFTDESLNEIVTGNFTPPAPPPAAVPANPVPVTVPVATANQSNPSSVTQAAAPLTATPTQSVPSKAPVTTPPVQLIAPPRPTPTIVLDEADSLSNGTNTPPTNPNIVTTPVPPLPAMLPPEPELPTEAKFTVKTVEYDYPGYGPSKVAVHIQALVPQDASGAVPSSASKIVFYAPPLKVPILLIPEDKKIGSDSNKMFWDLARIYGMTVFTARFPGTVNDVENRQTCYYYPESGAFNLALAVRDKLISDYSLKKLPMYIIGNSGGSSMAERWPIYYPNDVASVALIGGHYYDKLTKALNVPFLILNTRDDITTPDNRSLADQTKNLGMNALYAETPPAAEAKNDYERETTQFFHHIACTLGYQLLQQFTVGVAFSDNLADASKWPLRAHQDTPYDVYKPKPADPTNGTGKSIYFPSENFAALWQRVPYRHVEIEQSPGVPFSVTIRYPKDKPLGIVILQPDMDDDSLITGDWIDFLAMEGYIAVNADYGDDDLLRLKRTKGLLAWLLARNEFSDLKVGLIGFGTGGRHCFIAGAQNRSDRIAGIGMIDSPVDCPVPELSPTQSLEQLTHPVELGYSGVMSPPGLDQFTVQAQRSNKTVEAFSLASLNAKEWSFNAIEVILRRLFPNTPPDPVL